MYCQILRRCFMRKPLFTLCESNRGSEQLVRRAVYFDSSVFNKKSFSQNKMPKKDKTPKSTPKQAEVPTGPVCKRKDGELTIAVHAKPGAKQNAITDVSSEAVGVAIAAPPTDGEANAELLRYLSKVLELKKSEIVLDKGSKSREKIIKVSASVTQEEVLERLKREVAA